MASTEVSKIRLSGSASQAVEAILAGLPEDALVRDEDDGVGRYAGERPLVIRGRADRIMLFFGTYGSLKKRLDKPQLDVAFETTPKGVVVARLTREVPSAPTLGSRVMDVLGNVATVAMVVIAYHLLRSIPVDQQLTAIIAVVGGLAWSAVGFLRPPKEDRRLEELVRTALRPLVRKKRAKAKDAVDAPEPADAPATP